MVLIVKLIKDYLAADARGQDNMLSNWLHICKSISYEELWDLFHEFDFELLTDENRLNMIRASVYIEHMFISKGGRLPAWVRDSRLVAEPAYLGRGYNVAWLFFGPQALLSHNYFIDPGSLEIL